MSNSSCFYPSLHLLLSLCYHIFGVWRRHVPDGGEKGMDFPFQSQPLSLFLSVAFLQCGHFQLSHFVPAPGSFLSMPDLSSMRTYCSQCPDTSQSWETWYSFTLKICWLLSHRCELLSLGRQE
jgi:hypothetical protein